MQLNNQEIIKDLFQTLSTEDLNFIKQHDKSEMINLHHSLGQMIRNKYKLWSVSWEPDLDENMIDYSPDHPDARSAYIVECIYDQLNSIQPGSTE